MPRTVMFSDPIFPGAKLVDIDLTLSNAGGGSYEETFVDNRIITGMRVVGMECDELEAFDADIKFIPTFGKIKIQCADFSGTNVDVKLFLLKIVDDPTGITTTEYDILNNKIELIENVDVNYAVTIHTSDWELDSGEYIYEYENEIITTSNSTTVEFLEGDTDPDIDLIETEKSTGKVTFYAPYVPSADISVNIRITNARPKDIEEITGDMVATDVISGVSNVDEALTAINDKIIRQTYGRTGLTIAAGSWDYYTLQSNITIPTGYVVAALSTIEQSDTALSIVPCLVGTTIQVNIYNRASTQKTSVSFTVALLLMKE